MSLTVRVQWYPDAIMDAQALIEEQKKRARPHEATIGIHEEQGGQSKRWYDGREQVETLAEIMILHEFGDAGVPERSFLRAWFDARMNALAQGMYDAMRAEVAGDKTAVATWVANTHAAWKTWIAGGPFTPLSPVTVAIKTKYGLAKPETPLTATQQFVDAWRAKLDGAPL